MRQILANRRAHTVVALHYGNFKYHIGFGQEVVDDVLQPKVVEVFADAKRSGSDQEAILHDACIAMSLLLQYGCSCEEQAAAYSERRNEGETFGPPASILGAIARLGVILEKETK